MSLILALVVGWMHYIVISEVGVAEAVDAFVDKPLFSIASFFLIASPFCLVRRKPGWLGYLMGCLSGLILAAYFVFRAALQCMNWIPGTPVAYPLIGVVFALPFVWLLLAFVFSRSNRMFHDVTARHSKSKPEDGKDLCPLVQEAKKME